MNKIRKIMRIRESTPRITSQKKNFLLLLLLLLTTTGYAQSQTNEPRDSIVMQSTVYFAINQGEQIDPAYYKTMEKFLQWAQVDKATPIVIAGWADKSGTRGFNQTLSQRRAKTVRNYLVRKGVSSDRITFEGFGVDEAETNVNKARRADVRGVIRVTDVAKEPEKAEESVVIVEQPEQKAEQVVQNDVQIVENESQPKEEIRKITSQEPLNIVKSDTPQYRWYAGVKAGVPFAVSTLASFSNDKIYGGFVGGLYGGYRFSPILSLEVSAAWGAVGMGAGEGCKDYWLGSDNNHYYSSVIGMQGWNYSDLYSAVSLQQYGVHLNVNVLGFFNATKHSRWSLNISPALYGVTTKAAIKVIDTKEAAIRGKSVWHLGIGGDLTAEYTITKKLSVGVYTGLTHLTGSAMDGMPRYMHNANMTWQSGVRIGWLFGKESKKMEVR